MRLDKNMGTPPRRTYYVPGHGPFTVKTDPFVRELSLAAGGEVVSRHQERYIDGTLWSLQTVFTRWTWSHTAVTSL
jgi:hypothetical protein